MVTAVTVGHAAIVITITLIAPVSIFMISKLTQSFFESDNRFICFTLSLIEKVEVEKEIAKIKCGGRGDEHYQLS